MARQWMPMFWGDYARKTQHLSTIEHGAYLLLIAHYWNTGEPLPNNDEMLRRITRTSTKQWREMSTTIRTFFVVSVDKLHHERIDSELETSFGVSTSQSSRAVLGWKKRKNQYPDDAHGIAAAMQTTTTPTINKPPTEYVTASAEVFKNGFGDWDVIQNLTDKGLARARKSADGWDIYHLAQIYNSAVKKMGIPRSADAAFPAWCANYTKGKKPS